MANFTRKQIAEAIDKYQDEHPLYMPVTYDVTNLKDKESADTITEEINKIVAKVDEDTEMWLICEMAKMYMQGVVPHYEGRNKGEWIEVTRRISYIEKSTHWECSICREPDRKDGKSKFCCECGAIMRGGVE